MKKFIFFILLFSSSQTLAITMGRFVGMQYLINVTSKSFDGPADEDSRTLFDYMNVPIQDSMLGPGKALVAPEKTLNFICAKKGTDDYQCSIYVHKSRFGKISFSSASFKAQGQDAQLLAEQFHLKGGQFHFVNVENTLRLHITPDSFALDFNAEGL